MAKDITGWVDGCVHLVQGNDVENSVVFKFTYTHEYGYRLFAGKNAHFHRIFQTKKTKKSWPSDRDALTNAKSHGEPHFK